MPPLYVMVRCASTTHLMTVFLDHVNTLCYISTSSRERGAPGPRLAICGSHLSHPAGGLGTPPPPSHKKQGCPPTYFGKRARVCWGDGMPFQQKLVRHLHLIRGGGRANLRRMNTLGSPPGTLQNCEAIPPLHSERRTYMWCSRARHSVICGFVSCGTMPSPFP